MGVNKLLIPLASLMSGLSMLAVGTALLFAAIGVQAGSAKFSSLVTGLVMSAYFAGFVYGTYACPAMIRRVGHIRAFAAMASIASAIPMFHALWTNAWAWGLLRFVTGVCLVGLYIVVESWLNVLSSTAQRGKVFAVYMAVGGVSMAAGQWLILVGDRHGFVPFAMVSILFSFALIPITLTPVSEPETMEAPRFVLKDLIYISPIGVVGTIASGLLNGAFYSMGHLFGQGVGFSEGGIATFMAATILGGAAGQWPIGHFSDRHDRRWVLFWVCIGSAAVAALGFYLAREYEGSLIALGIFYGGLSMSIYSLAVAHVNDLIDSNRVLEVTSGLLLMYGIGSTAGPTVAGAVMDWLGPEALMLYFAGVLGVVALCVWGFASARFIHPSQSSHKTDYVAMGSGGSSQAVLQMDPRLHEPQRSGPAVAAAADTPR